MRRSGYIFAVCAALSAGAPALAQKSEAPEPLFAGSDVVRLTIQAPVADIIRRPNASDLHDGTLTVEGAARETLPVKVAGRGITRRKRETCTFPPLRLELPQKPASTSLFKGQKRLKLVTHCRQPEGFQQYVLLEYAAYRLLNVLTPLSLKVRPASITYVQPGSDKPYLTRLGFLIEDTDDAAKRNGMHEIDTGNIRVGQLSPRHAGRYAVFQYMIGNLDWAMDAGPPGSECCHNSKLVGAEKTAKSDLIPVPYDFDYSGFVNAPYAVPPPQVPVNSVRTRRYRGFCQHNAEAQAAAAEVRSAQGSLLAVLQEVPQLEEKNRRKAAAYLQDFFAEIGSDKDVAAKLLSTCLR